MTDTTPAYADDALHALNKIKNREVFTDQASAYAQYAQAAATLALVEEQHTANLLAYAAQVDSNSSLFRKKILDLVKERLDA